MWARLCLVFAATSIFLLAQTQMNVEQLADFVRSELALHQHSDKQIAAGVRDVQLTEKLTDKTIIDLQAQGAGPKTVDALKVLRDKTASLKPPSHDATSSPATAGEQSVVTGSAASAAASAAIPPPSKASQNEILQAIKDYALNYTKSLPNFFCIEVTRQFVDPNGGENYQHAGTVLAKLGFNEGHEIYSVYSVNNKLVETTMDDVKTGTTSTGEFYTSMKQIFDPASETEFHWDRWGKLRSRTMAVFNYSVSLDRSQRYIGLKGTSQEIRIAYRGLIFADPITGEIDRIKVDGVDIPKSFPVNATSETLDYDLVPIGEQKFVLPLTAKLFMKAGREATKNDIEFRGYRKYEADSFIKYNLDPNAPDPLPQSKTEEKPATAEPEKPAATPEAKPARKLSPFILPTTEDLPPPPPK